MAAAPWAWFLVRDLAPVMEVVAILLPPLAIGPVVVLAIAAAAWRSTRIMAASVSWLLFATVALVGPWLPAPTGTPASPVRIAAANVLHDNPAPAGAAADVVAQSADVVVVPEATPEVDAALRRTYEHAVRDDVDFGAVGVYSHLPLRELPLPEGVLFRSRALRVDVDGGRLVLWALHLPKPWFTDDGLAQQQPRNHERTVDRVLAAVDDEDAPVVVAGDLNLTDRGGGYRRFAADRTDAMRGIRGGYTSLKRGFRPLLLRIDHLLVPDGWCADGQRRFAISGSDHRGVTARVGPCET